MPWRDGDQYVLFYCFSQTVTTRRYSPGVSPLLLTPVVISVSTVPSAEIVLTVVLINLPDRRTKVVSSGSPLFACRIGRGVLRLRVATFEGQFIKWQ